MKTLFAFIIFLFAGTSSAEMVLITEVYELDNARLEKVGTSAPVVAFQRCQTCETIRIPLAENAELIFKKQTMTQQEYIMNYPKFHYFAVTHHLKDNQITEIQAF